MEAWAHTQTHMHRHTHAHTHTRALQLCKCMCHVLAVIFLGLCFAKGDWQLQHRVQYTSERLLLEMKAEGFFSSRQFGRHFLRLQTCTHIITIPSWLFSPFEVLFLTLLMSLLLNIYLTFIYLPIFHKAHQKVHFLCFSRFSRFPHFSFICFASSVHFTSLLCSFFIHLFFLHNPFISILSISLCVQLDVPPLPIHPHTCCYSLSVLWQCLWQG